MNFYNIENVEKITGIAKRNIKYWCSIYNIKLKKQGKRNLYDENAIRILKIIKKITDSGYFTAKYIKAKLDWSNGNAKQFEAIREFTESVDRELLEEKKIEKTGWKGDEKTIAVKKEKEELTAEKKTSVKRSLLDDIDSDIKQFFETRKENTNASVVGKFSAVKEVVKETTEKNEKTANQEETREVIMESKENLRENTWKENRDEESKKNKSEKSNEEIIGDIFVENKIEKGLSKLKNMFKKIVPNFKMNDETKIDLLKEKLAKDKNNIIMINQLGMEYAKNGYYKDAIEEFKKAIEMNPEYTDAYYNIGVVFDEIGDRKSAEEYWKIFLERERDGKFSEEIRKKIKCETGDEHNGN